MTRLNSPLGRLVGSVALLGLLAFQIDLVDLREQSRNVSYRALVGTVVLGLGLMVFSAYRWSQLVEAHHGVSLGRFIQLTFVSAYTGLFLPGTIGSEAVRVGGLTMQVPFSIAATSVVVDRVLSLFAQLVIAMFVLLLIGDELRDALFVWVILAFASIFVGVAIVFHPGLRAWMARLLDGYGFSRLKKQLSSVVRALEIYRAPRLLGYALFLAFIMQFLRGAFLWLCGLAIGADIAILAFLIALPLVSLIEVLPISIAGVGPREAAFSFVLAQFGVPVAAAISASLLAFISGTVVAAIIGFIAVAVFGVASDVLGQTQNHKTY